MRGSTGRDGELSLPRLVDGGAQPWDVMDESIPRFQKNAPRTRGET
jgi:hypothetical protein